MHTAHGNLHLEIQTFRKSPVGILRTSFREKGKMAGRVGAVRPGRSYPRKPKPAKLHGFHPDYTRCR